MPLIVAIAAAAIAHGEDPPEIEAIRQYALNYSESLPDYTCRQETKRVASGGPLRAGQINTDRIEEELSFVGKQEHYKVLTVNGAAVKNVSHEQLPGATSSGEFSGLLRQIFDPKSGTAFRPQGSGKLQGRTMTVLGFRVPQQTGYRIRVDEGQRYVTAAFEGTVWADGETNAVMKMAMKLVNIPKESPLEETAIRLEYKAVDLSGRQFILPWKFAWDWRERTRASAKDFGGTNEVDFADCRKFETESNIDFGK